MSVAILYRPSTVLARDLLTLLRRKGIRLNLRILEDKDEDDIEGIIIYNFNYVCEHT
jgi:hypothetical protein